MVKGKFLVFVVGVFVFLAADISPIALDEEMVGQVDVNDISRWTSVWTKENYALPS